MTDWIEPKTLLSPDNKQRALVDYIVKNDLLYLKDNASAVIEFTDLSDVPASYTDQGGKIVAIKEDESGLEFIDASGGAGDMLKATYDTDNDGRVDKAEAIDDGTHTATTIDIEDAVNKKHPANADTDLDATFEATFTKNADTNIKSNGWVLDEDDMASNLDTKVPTQQSVKAYADAVNADAKATALIWAIVFGG